MAEEIVRKLVDGVWETVLAETPSGGSLPSGGSTGEVLTKESNADGDVGWEPSGGSQPDATLLTGLLKPALALANTPSDVACLPDGSAAYVVSPNQVAVFVVDLALWEVIETIDLGSAVIAQSGLAVSPDGAAVYVALADDGSGTDGGVAVIATVTNTLTDTYTVGDLNGPIGLAVSPDSATLYVADFSQQKIHVVVAATGVITRTITVADNCSSLLISPDGVTLYTPNGSGTTLQFITAADGTLAHTVDLTDLEGSAYYIAITTDGATIYVPNSNTPGAVGIVDTATRVLTVVSTGSGICEYAAAAVRGYICDNNTSKITTVDGTDIVERSQAISGDPTSAGSFIESSVPTGIAVTGEAVYVADSNTPALFVLANVGLFNLPSS